MSVSFPETLILFATIHGGIPIKANEVETFPVPDGLKITRIMATKPGICNVTNEYQIERIMSDMNAKKFVEITDADVASILRSIQPTQSELIKEVVRTAAKEDTNKSLFSTFLTGHLKSPSVRTFTSGQPMLEKILLRKKSEGIDSAYDFKINAINMPGTPDIIDLIQYGTSGPSSQTRSKTLYGRQLKLSSLVDFLSQYVKHIVLIDFTCSTFMGDGLMTGREERHARLTATRQGYGRKRTRRQVKKTKARKSTKKRV
jgi:hypothetical protein